MNRLFISARKLCLAAVLLGLGPSCVQAQFVFTRIADTSTAVPGDSGTFAYFAFPPSISGDKVAFQANSSSGAAGIYLAANGTLLKAADSTTPMPDGNALFAMFIPPSLRGDKIVFEGLTASYQSGIYLFANGSLSKVADSTTPIPDGSGNFIGFGTAAPSGDDIAFMGTENTGASGVYLASGGTIRTIADENTPVPGGVGTFAIIQSLAGGDNAVILGYDSSYNQGLYLFSHDTLSLVADTRTQAPNGSGRFIAMSAASVSGDNVAFRGTDGAGKLGIYLFADGMLSTAVDSGSAVPESSARFTNFGAPALSGDLIALEGFDSLRHQGVYLAAHNTLQKVLAPDDTLEGKTVASASAPSLDGNHLALIVAFKDGSQGLYTVTIPRGNSISGILTFEGIVPFAAAQNVTFTFRANDGSPDIIQTASVSPSGEFSISRLPAKSYTVHIKGDNWLAQNVSVDTTNGNVSGVTADLLTGDANNDNRVDIGDFGLLVNAYSGDVTDPTSGYDLRTDFNGDGLVDIADFGLLVNNYGTSGAL